jgi:hypothetical protein
MRKNRLLITVAALGSAATIAAMAAPAIATPATAAIATSAVVRAAAHGTPGAVQDVTNPDFNFSCPIDWLSGSPVTYTVKTTGIHIRNNPAPNATILYSIAKGASFRSSWNYDGINFGCISPSMGGQQWVLGWDVSNNKHVGWVGRNYLTK